MMNTLHRADIRGPFGSAFVSSQAASERKSL